MAKRLTTLSNRYRTRPNNRLDSDRYQFLDITQAEPNPGNPESDGMVLSSLTSGVRSWTNNLVLSKLNFKAGTLDSVGDNDFYALVVKGNPFDGINDSIGIKNLNDIGLGGGAAVEVDTLDTVTTRGNVTANDITIGSLTADSATFYYNVTIQGDLIVSGTTTSINTQDLLVEDKNIVLANGVASAAAADSAGITIDGANATILYRYDSDAWKFNKVGVFDYGITVRAPSTLDSAVFNYSVAIASNLTAGITSLDSTTIFGTLNVQNVPSSTTQVGLFLEPDGTISQQLVEAPVFSGIASQLIIEQTNDNTTFYPLFIASSSGNDSVNIDLNLTYNASSNRLTSGNLTLTGIIEQPTALRLLTIDENDSVGYRDVSDITALVEEIDTLDTVTDRGNITTNAITVGNINAVDITAELANFDSTTVDGNLKFTKGLLDNSDRRLLIYDSTGAVLWGS